MEKIYKRLMCFMLAMILILSSSGNLFAQVYEAKDKKEKNTSISKEILKDKFPLSRAYLNKELKDTDSSEKIYVLQFKDGHKKEMLNKLRAIEGLEIKYQYDSIFEGASVKVKANKISEIRDMDGIKNIQENGTFIPQMVSAKKLTKIKEAVDYNEEMIKNLSESERNKRKLDGRGTIVAVIDSGIDIGHEAMKIDENAKPYMKYKNPDPGFTDKVPHGFSYVGGGNDLMDKVVAGHGMHCAGIIAGNNEKVKGVVPNAQLFSYRIFSDQYYGDNDALYEFGGDDSVYHAIDDAVKNGADVISMSIGQAGNGYAGDLYYETVNRATKKGVVVVSAIGNYGSASSDNTFDNNPINELGITDTSAMTYYSGIGKILAVGSVTNTGREARVIKIGDKKYPYTTLGSLDSNKISMERNKGESQFVFVGHGRESAYKGLDVEGKIVVSLRDGARNKGSKVVEKIEIAKDKKAKGIIIMNSPIAYSRDVWEEYPITSYENDPSMSELVKDGKIWAISVNGNDGEKIKELSNKGSFDVDFPEELISAPLASEVRLSGFSGWGPNAELELKPEVVAPGENIYSTMNRNRYGYMSGTSMATPHVSGISAMLVQKVNEIIKNPYFKDIGKSDTNKILIMNTAQPLKDSINTKFEVSPRRQGAGMIRADKAMMNDVFVTHNKKASVELKDFKENTKIFKLRLDNISNEDKSFKVNFSDVIGEDVKIEEKLLLKADKIKTGEFTDTFDKENVKISVPVKLENSSISTDKEIVTVPRNSNIELSVTLNTPGVDKHFVEGYIYFTSEDESKYPSISIPYFGYKGDWQEGPIIDKPMWEEGSIYKHTTVVGLKPDDGHGEDIEYKILGVDEKAYPEKRREFYGGYEMVPDEEHLKDGYMVDPDKIAFSVGFMAAEPKKVTLRMVALREVKDLEVAILNDKKEVVRVVSNSHNYRKQINNVRYESEWQAKVFHRPNVLFTWDGTIYNPKTGKMVYAPSGQYYYRVRAKVKTTDKYEETILPVKLDNTSPQADTENIKYTFSQDGNGRDINFKIKDENGLMFVGASLDNKPIEVKKISEDEYKIENLKINELTKSRLHIEAMDYATNLMEPINIDLNDNFIDFSNYGKVISGEDNILKAKIKNPKVSKIEAYQDDKILNSKNIGDEFEFNLDNNANDIRIIGKDENNNIIGEETLKIKRDLKDLDQGHNNDFGPVDYEKMPDDESSEFREALDYGMANYYIITDGSPLLNEESGQYYFNPSNGWYISLKEDSNLYLDDYILKATAYNTYAPGHEDYQPTWHIETNAERVPSNPNIPVYDGVNIINLTFVEKDDPEKIVFSRGVLVMIDTKNPELTLEEGNVDIEAKKVYANSNEVTLKGKVKDNLDEVYLDLNGDNIVTKLKQGDFGNTETEFEAKINVEEDDIVTFKTKDRFGNYENIVYKVVMDKTNPTIDVDESSINANTILNPRIEDNIGLREDGKQIFVNGKPYENGKKLNEYSEEGKYIIEIKAIDKAGNVAEKTLEIGIEDSDKDFSGVKLSKNKFTKDEVLNFKDFLRVPNGYEIIGISHIDSNNEKEQEVNVEVKNKLGLKEKLTFKITVYESENETDSINLDKIELKKTNFLPEEISVENLFDLPNGVEVKVEKIDASKVGNSELKVKFITENRSIDKVYSINILPELKAELLKNKFKIGEIQDINKVIKRNDNFSYEFAEMPSLETGNKVIKIIVKDNFGHEKEVNFVVNVIEESKPSPNPQPIPSPEVNPESKPERDKDKRENSVIKIDKSFKYPQYNPVGAEKEKEYKKSNTLQTKENNFIKDIQGHWAKDVILKAIKQGIVKGYPDNTFRPDKETSRSEFVTLINRVFKYKSSKDINFKDVEKGAWYEDALKALVDKSIIKGNEENKFLPNNSISREEIASILIRYIEKENPELLKVEMKELKFVDKDNISDWAREDIVKAYSIGILSGNDKNMIMAKDKATRAEVVKMIYNFKNISGK
ncbi:MAG: S8 family serine peptidase [Peptoniphilaceae bacterium]